MSRCVVNVATGRYVSGQRRLGAAVPDEVPFVAWADCMPPRSPPHHDIPYAFKAHALKYAVDAGFTTLLWADASIVPIAPLDSLFEKIEHEGCWISRNGYRNSEWTAETAYADLGVTHEENHEIEHVVATTFGLSLDHPKGRYILEEYLRLAQTRAFRGPWRGGIGVQHRHDQTALSVVAWRAGVELTNPPEWFAYRGGEVASTVLIADGSF